MIFVVLQEESLEDKFMFFQLPSALPMDMVPEVPKDEGSSNPAQKAAGSTKESISLDKLPEGFLGKMLVYESGAVKFQLGDVVFDVSTCAHSRIPRSWATAILTNIVVNKIMLAKNCSSLI